MVIDRMARAQLMADKKTERLVTGMKDTIKAMLEGQKGDANEEVLKLVVKREEDQQLNDNVGKLGQAIAMIYNVIKKPIILPKIFQVEGRVRVDGPVEVRNLSELKKYFDAQTEEWKKLLLVIQSMPQPQIKLPTIKIPEMVRQESPELTALLEKINEKLDNLQPQGEKISTKRTEELLESIASRPQMVPQPVNNVWLNPAKGFIKSSTTTVGTALTTLPGYGQLFNRRALTIWNNSANTIYIGGSDVTVNNGIPIPAGNAGLSMDIGYDCILYAVAAGEGNDVRVLEVSKDKVGDSPQE